MSDSERMVSQRSATPDVARLALASRGDALTPFVFDALARRFPVVGLIDPELTSRQRYQVAALTVRPTRSRWVERFYKSSYASRLRSRNALRQMRSLHEQPDVVFQVHSLFAAPSTANVLYIDCTHQQSVDLWPAWNPLRGRALAEWFRRERAAYASAQHLFAFCEPTRISLMNDYGVPAEKITVTGAGANVERIPELLSRASRTVDGPPTILFIGNDFVRKGGMVLLEAFERVRAVLPDARLQLVGTAPAIRPPAGVEVLGRIHDRARIAELYAGATVFAVPSFFDPYPLVLLEAMAFGVPAIATRQMGTPEMVDDGRTALLVDPGRAEQLAEALLRVLQDPVLAARLGESARRDVEERFTWDGVVDRMAPVLQSFSVAVRR